MFGSRLVIAKGNRFVRIIFILIVSVMIFKLIFDLIAGRP